MAPPVTVMRSVSAVAATEAAGLGDGLADVVTATWAVARPVLRTGARKSRNSFFKIEFS
jgi:hypothetical protein